MKNAIAIMAALICGAVHAAVPQTIDYQAYLTDTTGAPQNGEVTVTVALYADASNGPALWSDTLLVEADQGLIGIELGRATNPFPAGLFDSPKWLGITVAPDAEMIPRRHLKSVPYALKSNDADSVGGLQAGEIIGAAAGTQYGFVGFTTTSVSGRAGRLALHQACQADFGADARMATTAEVIANPIAGGSGGWVRPTEIVLVNYTNQLYIVDVPSLATVNGSALSIAKLNCNQWSTFGSMGLSVNSDYGINAFENCSSAQPVACSAP